MSIFLGYDDSRMPEQIFHDVQVHTPLYQFACETMAKIVEIEVLDIGALGYIDAPSGTESK